MNLLLCRAQGEFLIRQDGGRPSEGLFARPPTAKVGAGGAACTLAHRLGTEQHPRACGKRKPCSWRRARKGRPKLRMCHRLLGGTSVASAALYANAQNGESVRARLRRWCDGLRVSGGTVPVSPLREFLVASGKWLGAGNCPEPIHQEACRIGRRDDIGRLRDSGQLVGGRLSGSAACRRPPAGSRRAGSRTAFPASMGAAK